MAGLAVLGSLAGAGWIGAQPHPWLGAGSGGLDTLEERIAPPDGYHRIAADDARARWLRRLPLRAGRPAVHLHDGRLKGNQSTHHAVLAIDVGDRDLQQCADAVIRLRAELLWAAGCADEVAFDFTSGDRARWEDWRSGHRPRVSGERVRWTGGHPADASYPSFRRYLDSVFAYAGSASLERELEPVADPAEVEPGDVFVQGGFPGHAIAVLDVAANAAGDRVFLVAQSFMPAQEIHLLANPGAAIDPWYPARSSGVLKTPEWTFRYEDLRRFPPSKCLGEE